jgi:hypothetical protein
MYAISKISGSMAPLQVGVGIPGGAEAAVHALRRYVDQMPDDFVVVKLDYSNAFNSLRRDSLLEAVAKDLPELYRFAYDSYANYPILQHGTYSITSEEGPQQGDPLGPLEFCLAVQPLLKSLQSPFSLGYLDDFTFAGPAYCVAGDVRQISDSSQQLGLRLNVSKCEISTKRIGPNLDFNEFRGFKFIPSADLTLLGAPLMAGRAVETVVGQKLNDLNRAISKLGILDRHDALVLLKNSLSIPRLQYILRTSPSFLCPLLNDFDTALRNGLSVILNVSLSDHQWTQSTLPVRSGGLGIRSAVMLAPSAFLASAAGTRILQDRILPKEMHHVCDPLLVPAEQNWSKMSSSTPPNGQSSFKQKLWDEGVVKHFSATLLSEVTNPLDRARLLAAQSPHSADWLHAAPISSVGLRMSGEAVRTAIGVRLGLTVCQPHNCICGAPVDARGLHGLACQKVGGKHHRHGMVNDVIWRAMSRAKIPSMKEPSGLCRTDGKRPDGVTIIPWSMGRCLAWDATIRDTFCQSYIDITARQAGAAAEKAASSKKTKYASLEHSHIFVPVAAETSGCWSSESLKFIKELGKRISVATGDPRETAYLFQRLSVAIHSGNSISILNTFPATSWPTQSRYN